MLRIADGRSTHGRSGWPAALLLANGTGALKPKYSRATTKSVPSRWHSGGLGGSYGRPMKEIAVLSGSRRGRSRGPRPEPSEAGNQLVASGPR